MTMSASLTERLSLGVGAFNGCHRLSLVIAPPHLREAPEKYFTDCPLLTQLDANTEKNRRRALRLQYWGYPTHRLCSETCRAWVVTVLLLGPRLGAEDSPLPRLPVEMWLEILGFVPLWALGPSHRRPATLD